MNTLHEEIALSSIVRVLDILLKDAVVIKDNKAIILINSCLMKTQQVINNLKDKSCK